MPIEAASGFELILVDDRVRLVFASAPAEAGQDAGAERAAGTRIELTQQAAQRLAATLAEAIGRSVPVHERGAPPSEPPGRPAPAADLPTSREAEAGAAPEARARTDADAELLRKGRTPVNAPADPAGEKAALLMKRVAELGTPLRQERSFRVSAGSLLANRFLLTVRCRDIAGDARRRTLAICRELGMPGDAEAAAGARFDGAACVHFGFESGAGSMLCKLYLERAVSAAERARAQADGEPLLLHVAYKWDVAGSRSVTTRYGWRPGLDAAAIVGRLERVYPERRPAPSFDAACAVLALAAARVPAQRLQFLEVEEDGNPRRSFDLNLYDAKLLVRDMQPMLQSMRDHHGVRPGQFQALYDQIKGRALGHLAGGVHRDGTDFFTVYFGVGPAGA